ncbi:MAG: RecX family transcriptional regulator [Thermoleophilia bacterium]
MPVVTALRAGPRGQVEVHLDGAPWRTLPGAAVAAAGLSVGNVVDRETARRLRRELVRARVVSSIGTALARRDRSRQGLRAELDRRGLRPAELEVALETATDLGLVDDDRFAASTAARLAAKGQGDVAILFELERQGVSGETARAAVAALAPERERAAAIASRVSGDPRRLAALLGRRGFDPDVIEAVVAGLDAS